MIYRKTTKEILGESLHELARSKAEKEGIKLSDKEFHCRGKFTALHSGHPDEADIADVKAFSRKVIGDSK